jgi:GNAT superfamily N-acetyltransferase
MSAPALDVRIVPYTDPLVRPLLAELDHEYTTRYGHSLGDLAEEARRGAAEFSAPDGGLLLLLLDGVPVAGGAFRRHADPGTAELKRIWTDSAHRRRGLARRVLDELEREIIARGYRRIPPDHRSAPARGEGAVPGRRVRAAVRRAPGAGGGGQARLRETPVSGGRGHSQRAGAVVRATRITSRSRRPRVHAAWKPGTSRPFRVSRRRKWRSP